MLNTKFHWQPGESLFFKGLFWIGVVLICIIEVAIVWQHYTKAPVLRSTTGLIRNTILLALFIGGPTVGGAYFVKWMRGRSFVDIGEDGTLTVNRGIGEDEFNLQTADSIHVHNSGTSLTPFLGLLGAWIRPQLKTRITVEQPDGEEDTIHQGGMQPKDIEQFRSALQEFDVQLTTADSSS
ncbi:MAG: hypothetical protein ABEJ65_04755 [bacterium]